MSFAEVLEAVREMPKEQRLRLAGELTALRMREDPEYPKGLSRRLNRMEAGDFYTMDQVKKMHEELIRRGV